MEWLNKFLLYGDTEDIIYSPKVDTINYDWEEAKELLREKLYKSLLNISSEHLSFCGTTSGLVLRDLLSNDISKLWIFDGIDIDKLTDGYKYQYARFDIEKIEEYLFKINELSKKPRCSMEDLFAFHRQKQIKNETDIVYCEGGTDFLFLGFNIVASIVRSLFRRKEYNMFKAMKYLNGKAKIDEVAKHSPEIYVEIFNDNFFYFKRDEINDFGLIYPKILNFETQSSFMTSFFDLGYHMVYKKRTKVFGDHFGLKVYSPFYNDPEFVDFCLSVPMEMKYCVGRKKHILKESFDISKYRKLPHFDLERTLFNHILKKIGELSHKYLSNKNSRIFNYLPFDKVQQYILPDNKKTIVLLNLAIWMEINKC